MILSDSARRAISWRPPGLILSQVAKLPISCERRTFGSPDSVESLAYLPSGLASPACQQKGKDLWRMTS
jgi:hypothetical protein